MQTQQNPLRLVRELKGAPLSILVALSIVRQTVNINWLVDTTGYSDKSIAHALGYMKEVGLINLSPYGCSIAEGTQLALTLENLTKQLRRNSDSTTTLINLSNIDTREEEVDTENFRKCLDNPQGFALLNLQAMAECGIGANETTRRLAEMGHVTPEYIRAHVKAANGIGLAITRMLNAEPPPAARPGDRNIIDYKEWES